ncbi:hypothetical protein MMC18_001986 [Xylographa bjoerkii]|nr:hypothetical protein [Xylographa bjoerkii]
MALRFMKTSRATGRLDVQRQWELAAGLSDGSMVRMQPEHPFLPYAQSYWLYYTKVCHFSHAEAEKLRILWIRLLCGQVNTVKLPWGKEVWIVYKSPTDGTEYRFANNDVFDWITKNPHGPLVYELFVDLYRRERRVILETQANDAFERALVVDQGSIAREMYFLGAKLHKNWMRLVLEKNELDVNAQWGLHGTALQAASSDQSSRLCNEAVVRLLLDHGADVNVQGGRFGNALQEASYAGNKGIVRLLLERGANVNAKGGNCGNALLACFVSLVGSEGVLRILLEYDVDVNAQTGQTGNYSSPLHAAVTNGRIAEVVLLLDKGADTRVRGGDYGTVLHAAAAYGYIDVVKVLLERGADINAPGAKYGSVLEAAEAEGHKEISQLLREVLNSS